ncbi:hypothetical protein BH09PAT1_BH09PAT1_6850 [soil metagenome]
MLTKKSLKPVTIAVFMGASTFLTTMPAFAQTTTPSPTPAKVNFFDGLAKYIADTFHLDQNQVKTAVNTYKTQHQVANQQTRDDREKTRLDQLVNDGKITSSQETAIVAELASLKTKYNPANIKDMTAAQRKAQFDAMQSEIQTWAKNNNIDPKYLMQDFGMGMKRGVRRADWRSHKPTTTTTPTQ